MTPQQLARWKQMSLGLARSYTDLTPARKAKLLEAVDDCIEWVICNGLETVTDWDGSEQINGIRYACAATRVDEYLWDNKYEFERENRRGVEVVRGRFGDMLSASVRAGFDVAVAPSGGVIGFTVGNLWTAFDGDIPEWVTGFFDPPLPADAQNTEGLWL